MKLNERQQQQQQREEIKYFILRIKLWWIYRGGVLSSVVWCKTHSYGRWLDSFSEMHVAPLKWLNYHNASSTLENIVLEEFFFGSEGKIDLYNDIITYSDRSSFAIVPVRNGKKERLWIFLDNSIADSFLSFFFLFLLIWFGFQSCVFLWFPCLTLIEY